MSEPGASASGPYEYAFASHRLLGKLIHVTGHCAGGISAAQNKAVDRASQTSRPDAQHSCSGNGRSVVPENPHKARLILEEIESGEMGQLQTLMRHWRGFQTAIGQKEPRIQLWKVHTILAHGLGSP